MLAEPMVHASARRLARRGMTLDLWRYFHQLDDMATLARACADLKVVLDHFAGPIGIGP